MIINLKENKLYMSTPDRAVESIDISINANTYSVAMPKEEIMKGSSVSVSL